MADVTRDIVGLVETGEVDVAFKFNVTASTEEAPTLNSAKVYIGAEDFDLLGGSIQTGVLTINLKNNYSSGVNCTITTYGRPALIINQISYSFPNIAAGADVTDDIYDIIIGQQTLLTISLPTGRNATITGATHVDHFVASGVNSYVITLLSEEGTLNVAIS